MLSLSTHTFSRSFALAVAKGKVNRLPPKGLSVSPFAMFLKEQYEKKTELVSSGKVTDSMRAVANTWKSLPDTTKKHYSDLSTQFRESKIAKFETLSDQEKSDAINAAVAEKLAKSKRKERKEKREMYQKTDHPARPSTAMTLYIKDQFEIRKNKKQEVSPATKYLTMFVDEWKTLEEDKKKEYESKAKIAREEYSKKVQAWKESVKASEAVHK